MALIHVDFVSKTRLEDRPKKKGKKSRNYDPFGLGDPELIAAAFKTIRGKKYLDVGMSLDHPSPEDFLKTAVVIIYEGKRLVVSERVLNVIPLEDVDFHGDIVTNRLVLRVDGTRFAELKDADKIHLTVRLEPGGRTYSWDYIHLCIMDRVQCI